MQIRTLPNRDFFEFQLSGRLDAESAPVLQQAIDDAIRQGIHSFILDLSDVNYVSSAGLAVLVKSHKQLQKIGGFFGAGGIHGPALEVIQLTGLGKVLLCDLREVRERLKPAGGPARESGRQWTDTGILLESQTLSSPGPMRLKLIGDPLRLAQGVVGEQDTCQVSLGPETYAVGVGGFGNCFQDCFDRLGELIAIAGAVAVLPTVDHARADYHLQHGDYVPTAYVATGVTWSGQYERQIQFEIEDSDRAVGLSTLLQTVLTDFDVPAAACVLLAETTGFVGASLRKSPGLAVAGKSRFEHPDVREWLTYAPEKVLAGSLALVTGVVARQSRLGESSSLRPHLRRLAAEGDLVGHFHAAAFPYQPLTKRDLKLSETVHHLFDSGQLQGLFHLLNDERPITGVGQTEFTRGVLWINAVESGEAGR
jgi:anti-anti-sigma factor